MKKFICGSAVVLSLCSTMAHAQSSVTLYGIIDAGLTYFSNLNGHGTIVAQDGSVQANRWGVRGTEDLGDGRSVVFVLENGFNLYSGSMVQSGVIFSRQAFLGLSDRQLGTITLGKQYDFFWDDLTQFSMGQKAGQYSWHPGDFDHLAGTLHINNAIKYATPTYAGFSAGGLYATPSQSVSAGTGRVFSVGARYSNGPVNLGTAYTNTHDLGLNAPSQAGTTLFVDLPAGPVMANTVSSFGIGGSYLLGSALTRVLLTDTHFVVGNNSGSMPTIEANEVVTLSPATSIMAGYWFSKLGAQHWQNATLMLDYALSKRTDVYTTASYLWTSGGAAPVFLGGGSSPVFENGMYSGTGSSACAVRVGLRTYF